MPCGMYVAALTIKPVRGEHLIRAKGIEPSISARNGAPMYDRVSQTQTRSIQRNRTCPRAYLAGEWARWTRTPDEVTNRADESSSFEKQAPTRQGTPRAGKNASAGSARGSVNAECLKPPPPARHSPRTPGRREMDRALC